MTNASFHRERITALFQLEVSDAYKNTNYCSRLGGRIPADRLRRKGYSYPVNTEIFDSSITPEMTLSLTPYRRQQIGEWFFQGKSVAVCCVIELTPPVTGLAILEKKQRKLLLRTRKLHFVVFDILIDLFTTF